MHFVLDGNAVVMEYGKDRLEACGRNRCSPGYVGIGSGGGSPVEGTQMYVMGCEADRLYSI